MDINVSPTARLSPLIRQKAADTCLAGLVRVCHASSVAPEYTTAPYDTLRRKGPVVSRAGDMLSSCHLVTGYGFVRKRDRRYAHVAFSIKPNPPTMSNPPAGSPRLPENRLRLDPTTHLWQMRPQERFSF